jgi:hypothetical protein
MCNDECLSENHYFVHNIIHSTPIDSPYETFKEYVVFKIVQSDVLVKKLKKTVYIITLKNAFL